MSFKQEEKQIGQYTFQVNSLPYSDAQKVLFKAKELLMLKVADTGQFEEGLTPLSASVFLNVDPDNLDFVVNKLAEKSRVKESGGQFVDLKSQKEILFASQMELMFKWLDFAIEVNFANFLDELKRTAAKQMDQAGALKSQKM